MLEFVVDKTGTAGTSRENNVDNIEDTQDDVNEENCSVIPLEKLSSSETDKKKKKTEPTNDYFSLKNTYIITNYSKEEHIKDDKSYISEIMKNCILSAGLEKEKVAPVKKSKRALKRERKIEREKTKGKDWFNLPATKVTEEIKNDLEILKMRSVLDSKQFYKKNDIKVIPKYFQIGKVVEGAADFYNGRIPKSQRRKTLVDELLADSNFRAIQKRKYKEIVDESRRKKNNKNTATKKKVKQSHKDDWLKWN